MHFVQASLLAMHINAQPDSKIGHWVHINTPVEILSVQKQMIEVRLVDRPDEHPVTGWVDRDYLSETPITFQIAQSQLSAAQMRGDVHESTIWNERLVALNPTHAGSWAGLGDLPPTTAQVAICEGERAHLLGTLSDDGFQPGGHWDGTQEQLEMLSTHRWLRVGKSGLTPVSHSPFVSPFATPTWNERGYSAYASGTCDGICDEQLSVVLGPCDNPGSLYVSAPIAIPTDPVSDRVEVTGRVGEWVVATNNTEVRVPVTWADEQIEDVVAPLPQRTWLLVSQKRIVFLHAESDNWAGIEVFEVTPKGVQNQGSVQLYGVGC